MQIELESERRCWWCESVTTCAISRVGEFAPLPHGAAICERCSRALCEFWVTSTGHRGERGQSGARTAALFDWEPQRRDKS
jgi:hypothetical protein